MTQTDTKYKAPVELEPTPTRPIFIIEYLGIGVTQLNKSLPEAASLPSASGLRHSAKADIHSAKGAR